MFQELTLVVVRCDRCKEAHLGDDPEWGTASVSSVDAEAEATKAGWLAAGEAHLCPRCAADFAEDHA